MSPKQGGSVKRCRKCPKQGGSVKHCRKCHQSKAGVLSAVGSAQSKAGVLSAVGSVTMPEVDVVCAGPPLAAGWWGATAVLHQ